MWTREQVKTNAKAVMAKHYWMMMGVSALYSVLAGIFSSSSSSFSSYLENSSDSMPAEVIIILAFIVLAVSVVGIIFNIFVSNPLEVGKDRFYMCSRLQQAAFGELFCAFKSGKGYYLNIVKTQFLRRLYTGLWSLLFIIPGIIKSYEYYMVPYILAENPNISTARAFELSKIMTNGEKWNIFVLELSFMGWQILGMLACCIGTYFVLKLCAPRFLIWALLERMNFVIFGIQKAARVSNFYHPGFSQIRGFLCLKNFF